MAKGWWLPTIRSCPSAHGFRDVCVLDLRSVGFKVFCCEGILSRVLEAPEKERLLSDPSPRFRESWVHRPMTTKTQPSTLTPGHWQRHVTLDAKPQSQNLSPAALALEPNPQTLWVVQALGFRGDNT